MSLIEGELTIAARGELDHTTVGALAEDIDRAIRHPGSMTVTVDLAQATFISAALLGTLVAARKRARIHGVRLVVRVEEPRLRRLFTITDLESTFLTQ